MAKTALIIGNGPTRKGVDLGKLQAYVNGVSFGANALYRDFTPDFLVAIDPAITDEITKSGFPTSRFIVPPIEEQFEPWEFNPNRPRENTGMIAMREAIKRGFNELVCVGMDFLTAESGLTLGNVYAGTNAYGEETRSNEIDIQNRRAYFKWFVAKHPNVEFLLAIPPATVVIELNAPNVDWINLHMLTSLADVREAAGVL